MTDGVVNNLIWYGDAPDDWPECRIKDVAYISEETHREMNSTNTRPCDVLLNITGASIGRCSFALDIFCRPAAFVGYPSFLFAKSDDHPVVKPIWT